MLFILFYTLCLLELTFSISLPCDRVDENNAIQASVCPGNFVIPDFNADAEVRIIDEETKLMIFTAQDSNPSTCDYSTQLGCAHLYMAVLDESSNEWVNCSQVTWSGSHPISENGRLLVLNEVASFSVSPHDADPNLMSIQVVYNRNILRGDPAQGIPKSYVVEEVSLRTKFGVYVRDSRTVLFTPETVAGIHPPPHNTFVLLANENSTDLPYALNSMESSGCLFAVEPSFVKLSPAETPPLDAINLLSLACLDARMPFSFGIKLFYLYGNLTLSPIPSPNDPQGGFALSASTNEDFCQGVNPYPGGWQAGSLISTHNELFLVASPLTSIDALYSGSVWFKFKNALKPEEGLESEPSAAQFFGLVHSGSSTGGNLGPLYPSYNDRDVSFIAFVQASKEEPYLLYEYAYPIPMNQPVTQSMSQSFSQSMAQSISQSISESISQSMSRSISQSMTSTMFSSSGMNENQMTNESETALVSASPSFLPFLHFSFLLLLF